MAGAGGGVVLPLGRSGWGSIIGGPKGDRLSAPRALDKYGEKRPTVVTNQEERWGSRRKEMGMVYTALNSKGGRGEGVDRPLYSREGKEGSTPTVDLPERGRTALSSHLHTTKKRATKSRGALALHVSAERKEQPENIRYVHGERQTMREKDIQEESHCFCTGGQGIYGIPSFLI